MFYICKYLESASDVKMSILSDEEHPILFRLGDIKSRKSREVCITALSMMLTVFAILLPLFASVKADWWTVEWDATEFTSMSGDMIVPNVPNPPGTPYVWPGLQPGSTGVLQAVLDGR